MSASTEHPSAHIWLLPYQSDPVDFLCTQLLQQFKTQLPNLTHVTILMPTPHAAQRLRQCLSDQANKIGFPALLGPNIQNLSQCIEDTSVNHKRTTIPKATRELMLVEALREYPHLYGKSSPWLLAEDLLQLFDELSQQQIPLPDTLEQFSAELKKAYSVPESASADIEIQLSQEATLVHTLWQAWQQQLADENSIDQSTLYIEKLANFTPINNEQHIFLLGYTHFIPAEQQWFTKLAKRGQATLITQGVTSEHHDELTIKTILPDSPNGYDVVIDDIYMQHSVNIATRANNMAKQYVTSPLQERISILAASNAEQEALGIELQVRQWLHEGKQNIAIVTQDRRLARRLRALLERTHITLRDYSGWALSTTRAAATLERWLECIEQDFNHLPLLDLLKSSFVFNSIKKESFLYNVYRFEQDIVLHENIASGLYRYQRQIERRTKRIDETWTKAVANDLQQLLKQFETAAKPLQTLQRGKHHPAKFIDALLSSMVPLELLAGLSEDEAGQRIIDEINIMRLSLEGRQFSISWSEFRSWLGRTLERYNFAPTTAPSSVHLLDLNSSLLSHYDALIIAAADAEHLPGRPAVAAFFNNAVRYSLQLQTSEQYAASMYYHYRCLLHSAPTILISYTADIDGNANLASPWLACLQHYQHIAWGQSLDAQQLQQWLLQYNGYSHADNNQTVELTHEHPAVVCDEDLLPLKLSASGYQKLIDCPYQYFASYCLGLKATDEIKLVLEKSDYGHRIHRCLQAFHTDKEDLPGPFTEEITASNRKQAIQCLEQISETLFSRDLEDNFQHRGWLQTWRRLIPLYITWQMKRQLNWHVIETEKEINDKQLSHLQLNGVIDRVDNGDDGLGIIDYKTGAIASKKDIYNGEAVQLPFYVLLLDSTIQQAEYLKLSDGKVTTSGQIEGDELLALAQAQSERINTLFSQLRKGEALPAWGDSKSCSYCDIAGLCRRGAWQTDPEVVQ